MVGVDTHLVLLHVESKLALVYSTQLMVWLEVRPAPQPAVDYMREAFSVRYLQTPVQRPNRDGAQHNCEPKSPILHFGAPHVLYDFWSIDSNVLSRHCDFEIMALIRSLMWHIVFVNIKSLFWLCFFFLITLHLKVLKVWLFLFSVCLTWSWLHVGS